MMSTFSHLPNLITRRWLPLLCVVVLLHLFIVHWSFAHFRTPLSRVDSNTSIAIELIPTPSAAPPVHSTATINLTPSVNSSPAASARSSVQLAPEKQIDNSNTSPSANNNPTTTSLSKSIPKISVKVDVVDYVTALPPSAELKYKLKGLQSGLLVTGEGHILWMRSNYTNSNIHGDFTVSGEPYLRFMSDGFINQEHGITPSQYIEQRSNRAESKAIFGSDDNIIRFSTSQQTYPRLGGEQDPASVIWQLAGIGRHDGKAFYPDGEFQMFVAGARTAGIWLIHVVGLEEIETPMGKMQAWHLVRAAPMGSDEQSIDIWLAPDKEWYPVKLRYTEANGDILDLSVSEIALVPDT